MSLLRSTERILEGNIGGIEILPLIGYTITVHDLLILDNSLSNTLKSFMKSVILKEDFLGRINLSGINESNNNSNTQYLSEFISKEVMRFWSLPKKVSIRLFEKEVEEIYIIRPQVIEEYLVVEEVSILNNNYCEDTYSLGLGENNEIISNKYWRCNYIDSIKVSNYNGTSDNWIEWISF